MLDREMRLLSFHRRRRQPDDRLDLELVSGPPELVSPNGVDTITMRVSELNLTTGSFG